MKSVTAARMREIDRAAIEVFGIQGIVLMENAGRAVAQAAETMLRTITPADSKTLVSIACGGGNNAGDGFVAARYLHNKGFSVELVLLKQPSALTGDALTCYQTADRMRIPAVEFGRHTPFTRATLIIDALLGTGTKGLVAGNYRTAIEEINASSRPVLSIDLPSGVDADTGMVLGTAVKADTTVTLCLYKDGLRTPQGILQSGNILLADIGIPAELLR